MKQMALLVLGVDFEKFMMEVPKENFFTHTKIYLKKKHQQKWNLILSYKNGI